jgi:DNA-binding response OmpR family regulator
MKRILVVEDENDLAMELAWLVEEAGYAVLGPERSVAEACRALATSRVDLALLDLAVGGEALVPLSRLLADRDIPFIFLAAAPAQLPAQYGGRPVVAKPWQPAVLLSLIGQLLAADRNGHAKATELSGGF